MIKNYQEEIFCIKNSNNEELHGVYNYIDKKNPLIIITPQFEKTIRTNLGSMIYLINNGFNVFRYDNRYHNGNSTGNIESYKLSQVIEDLDTVMEFIQSEDAIETDQGIGLLGISISSRTIFRYLSQASHPIDVLVSLVGVVNMQATIEAILEHDYIEEVLKDPNKTYGVQKVLHYPINWDIFIRDMIEMDLYSLESTKNDIKDIDVPIYLVASEEDKWININDYNVAFKDNKNVLKEMYKLPNAGHELYKNPQAAEYAMEKIVEIFDKYYQVNEENHMLIKPKVTELIRQNKKERMRERAYI